MRNFTAFDKMFDRSTATKHLDSIAVMQRVARKSGFRPTYCTANIKGVLSEISMPEVFDHNVAAASPTRTYCTELLIGSTPALIMGKIDRSLEGRLGYFSLFEVSIGPKTYELHRLFVDDELVSFEYRTYYVPHRPSQH